MKKILILILFIGFLFVNVVPSLAAYNFEDQSGLKTTASKDTGAGYDTSKINLPEKIGKIISIVLSFLGVIFLLLMIYAGYMWMTARGNEDQITKAKTLIKNAIIGLIVVLAAYAVTVFFKIIG